MSETPEGAPKVSSPADALARLTQARLDLSSPYVDTIGVGIWGETVTRYYELTGIQSSKRDLLAALESQIDGYEALHFEAHARLTRMIEIIESIKNQGNEV